MVQLQLPVWHHVAGFGWKLQMHLVKIGQGDANQDFDK